MSQEPIVVTSGQLDGYIRAHHVSCIQRTPATAPTVTFIQDDGTADAYTKLKPFLETNSLAMTLAIPTRNIGDAGYLTLAQLTEMHDDDLITTASHGIDWNESDMDDLTEAQLHAVYSESQDWLTTHGFEGDVFVAPHHQMDRLARQVCARYFRACRANEKASTVDGHGIIRSPIQTFNLPCHLLSTTDLDASDITDAQAAIDEMVSLWDSGDGYATWILFTIHTVDDTRIASLQSLVDYIDSKSVFQYKTFQDGLDLFENYADFGEMGDSLCECVHISPWGDIGCRELDTHSMIRVWSPASPWYKYHSIEFKEGGIYDDDLLLTAKPDGSGSVTVRCDALIPYLGEADLGHRDDGRWDDVITEQLSVMSNHRSAYAIKHKYLNNQSLSGASTDITTGLPDPHLLLGVAYRVRTAIEGATSWDGDFLGGATEKFADDAGLTQNTKGEFIMAPAKVTGTNNIRITANGSNFTAGVIDLTVYYIEIDEMDDV